MSDTTMESFDTEAAAARQVATQPPPVQHSNPAPQVLQLGNKPAEPVETTPLFAIDGVTYSIPTKIRTNVALAIMSKLEREGEIGATMFMLRKVLGEDAFEALTNYEGLDDDDLKAITDKVTTLVFASGQGAVGK